MRWDIRGQLERSLFGLMFHHSLNDFLHGRIVDVQSQIRDECQFVERLAGRFVTVENCSGPVRQLGEQGLDFCVSQHRLCAQ